MPQSRNLRTLVQNGVKRSICIRSFRQTALPRAHFGSFSQGRFLRELLLAQVLIEDAGHIRSAVAELLDHPRVAAEHAVRAKRSENRIDSLYHQAAGRLFDSDADMNQILKAREIYRHLKNSADRIDRAADEISVIVIKSSS